ncbi:DoxX family protein [Nocardia yamanashiensis]|uniref:DoxX family protein n=1 Tax=Nocardia yamanashiensis TaxID=209247 RepID=UPI00082B3B28|nr:DoxX family protein [Nocardia yamanashiensis]
MSTQVIADPGDDLGAPEQDPKPVWNPFARIGFRFVVSYLTLFCVIYPQPIFAFLGIIARWLPDDAQLKMVTWPESPVHWVGRTVFDVDATLRWDSGSGDQTYLWVLCFCILITAVLVTAVWSVLDRKRTEYRRVAAWFLLFLRFVLAGQMLGYGFAKLVPLQMGEPTLTTLLTPYGDLTHMAVLWNQVGASPVYEMLLGAAEVLGGLLLLLPRTALAGVLLSLVSMAQVWVLNMTFDVPVKLLSFHLLLISLVLLAPDARRLFTVLSGHATGPSTTPEVGRTPRGKRIVAITGAVLAVWFVIANVAECWEGWHKWGPGQPKSELYGIWVVGEFTRDGQPVPPLLTDETRWQRVVFERPEMAFYQRMDGALVPMLSDLDAGAHRITLKAPPEGTETLGSFTFERPSEDRLILTGELDGHPVVLTLTATDLSKVPVRQGGLHLVQDYPRGVS